MKKHSNTVIITPDGVKKYSATVGITPDGDAYIPLPEELIESCGWDVDTLLNASVLSDGSISLTKIEQNPKDNSDT